MNYLKSDHKFQWIGEGITLKRGKKFHYKAFSLGNLKITVGNFVLVRNDDALDPEDRMSSYVAQVKDLFDSGEEVDPYKAQVQWFSKIPELPAYAFKSVKDGFHEYEVVQDTRSSWHDIIDAETIFQICDVLFLDTDSDCENIISSYCDHPYPVFVCRYAFTGMYLKPVMKDMLKQMSNETINSTSVTNGFESPIRGKKLNTLSKNASDYVSDVSLLQADNENENNVVIKKSKSRKKRGNFYCTIPVLDSKFPKVVIKKIDDRILESKKGNVRVIVADSNVDSVTEAFLEKLKLEKRNDYESSPEKRPTIHTFKTESDVTETNTLHTNTNFLNKMSKDSEIVQTPKKSRKSLRSVSQAFQAESDVAKTDVLRLSTNNNFEKTSNEHETLQTPKKTRKNIYEENGTPVTNKLYKNVSERITRSSPRKSVALTNVVKCSTPEKKLKMDDLCLTRSGRRSLSINYTEDVSVTQKSPRKSPAPKKVSDCSTPQKKARIDELSVTRSGRRVKPVCYSEQKNEMIYDKKVSFSKTTPSKKKLPRYVISSCSDDSDVSNYSAADESCSDDESSLSGVSALEDSPSKNLKKQRHFSKSKKLSKRTSSTTRKSSRMNSVSFSIPERKTPLKAPQNPLEESRQRLHVSAVPDSLPCREEEYSDIYSFVKGCLLAKTGACMYISGVPGTGKTATVHEVMRNLEEEKESGEVPIFTFVEVNGMWMTDPYQCYAQIFKALTGKSIAPQQAADLLEKRFTEPGPKKDAVVLLVDELDRLWTRKQTVMYNIFDWPTKRNSKLVVLAIANTMDLPERMMMNRISSRLGLTRKTFQPYTFKQLQEIIMSRIQELKVFDPDAVQLVARKVAAVSGDARRALDICRFAAEIVKIGPSAKKGQKVLVGMEHVDKALQQIFSSPVILAIKSSSKLAKLFLQCMLSEFNRIGLEETTLKKVQEQVRNMCRFEGLIPPNSTDMSRICNDLAASHLILVDNFKNDLYMKIRLSISPDDVAYALTNR